MDASCIVRARIEGRHVYVRSADCGLHRFLPDRRTGASGPELHGPLASVTWSRDIDLREDVSRTKRRPSRIPRLPRPAARRPTVRADRQRCERHPELGTGYRQDGQSSLPLWGMELGCTLPNSASAQLRPVDQQKYDGMQLKYNMDIDEQVYIGDGVIGVQGLRKHEGHEHGERDER